MNTKKNHLGFKKVSAKITKEYEKKGTSEEKAEKIGAATADSVARNASSKAKKANSALKKVKK